MKRMICVFMILIVSPGFLFGQDMKFTTSFTLKTLWASDQVFETPESVVYDSQRDMIYVSNINGSPIAKDGNGFISKLKPDGTIEELKWIDGLNAPKGMRIYQNKLYVADLVEVVEINIEENRIVHRYKSNEAEFMNDVTVDASGTVYISDNRANIIFRLKNGKLINWIKSADLKNPNGLYAEQNYLLAGIRDAVLCIDVKTKTFSEMITGTGYIDGLVPMGDGYYIISNFQGAVHAVHPEKEKIKILDTSEREIMAADIDYNIEKNLLLVPTFYDNRIFAYRIEN